MEGWVATALAVFGATTPLIGLLWKNIREMSNLKQHFDPSSPVGQAVGTIPQRLDGLSKKIETADNAIIERLKNVETHMHDVTVWKPMVDKHQTQQDHRLSSLEVRRGTV